MTPLKKTARKDQPNLNAIPNNNLFNIQREKKGYFQKTLTEKTIPSRITLKKPLWGVLWVKGNMIPDVRSETHEGMKNNRQGKYMGNSKTTTMP